MAQTIKEQQIIGPKSHCSINSKKVFFTFSPGEPSFQQGYLGASSDVFLAGVLNIRYTNEKPIFAKKVEVSFVGKENVFFTGTLEEGKEDNDCSDYDDDDNVSTHSLSTHTAKRTIFRSSVCLWRSKSKGSYEAVKELNIPFRFKLPENLPPSLYIDKGCGKIYYMLKATISRQPIDPNSQNYKKMVKIICPIVRYTITPSPSPSRWLVKQEGHALPHSVGYDVSLSHSTFGSGACLVVPVKLTFHEPQIYLKKIFVGIKEYHELRTNKYETMTKKYITEETVDANSIPISSGPENVYSVDVKLSIPSARNLAYSVNSTYITVSHKVKVKIFLGKAPDIHLSKFINIKNVICKNLITQEPEVKISTVIHQKLPPKVDVRPQRNSDSKRKTDSKRKSDSSKSRRSSPFLPMFSKIHVIDSKSQKHISMMKLFNLDQDNPSLYNSRSLISAK